MRKKYISIFETAYKELMEAGAISREDAIVNAMEVVSSEIAKHLDENPTTKPMSNFSTEVKDFMEYFTDKYLDEDVDAAMKEHCTAEGNVPFVFYVFSMLIETSNTQELEAAWAVASRNQKAEIKPFVDTIANADTDRVLELYFDGHHDEYHLPGGETNPEDKHALETYLFRALKYGAIGFFWKWDEVQGKSILSTFHTSGGAIFACNAADAEKMYYTMQEAGLIEARETPPLFADFDVKKRRKRTGSKKGQGKKAKNLRDGNGTEAETISGEKDGRRSPGMQILPKDETASGVDGGSTETEKSRRSDPKRKVKFTVVKAGDDSFDDDSDSDGSGSDE